MNDTLENMVLRTVERWWAGRYSERHALVTSYDKKNYLAKVRYQPEGQESGWMPIETGHIGSGYGIAIGLKTGHGGGDDQAAGAQGGAGGGYGQGNDQSNNGDQVVVRHQEGDFESGKIVQRVHSDNDKPPEVESGEMVIWTKFDQQGQPAGSGTGDGSGSGAGGAGSGQGQGQQIWLKKDGSVTITDGNGATYQMDGQGNVSVTAKKVTVNGSDAITVNGSKTIDVVGSQNVTVKSNGATTHVIGRPIRFNRGGPPGKPFMVP